MHLYTVSARSNFIFSFFRGKIDSETFKKYEKNAEKNITIRVKIKNKNRSRHLSFDSFL